MPSYQSPTPLGDPTGRWPTFTAAVAVSAATRDWLATKITRRRHKIRSRWPLLDPTTQATLVLALLRTNLTHAELAAANHIKRQHLPAHHQRSHRPARRTGHPPVRGAAPGEKSGWEYLLIDGVNVPTIAFARRLNRQQHYSGKHRRHAAKRADHLRPPTGGCCGSRPPYRKGQRHHRRGDQ
jgi:hypothetical protein